MQHPTDDMYVLDAYLAEQHHLQQSLYHQQQQYYQHQQQQQQQRRVYGYQNYASSPSIASYAAPWEFQHIGYSSVMDPYAPLATFDPYAASPVEYSPYQPTTTVHPSQLTMNPQAASCSDSTLYSSYVSQTQHQHSQQQHIPTCIAPEDVFSPLTALSDTDSGSSDGASSPISSSTRHNSPTRLGLSIPTVSLVHPITNASWANLTPSGPSSTLSSPVESLSSHASSSDNDNETSFVPPPSLKKSASLSKANKRATRSAAPEPAWVEAALALNTDDVASAQSHVGPVRAANRPIAFACVFCRHRKIQCIRPKTEVAPGEKPPPCNQCEKRSRCCEYPPAALNPRGPIRRTSD